jgi:hypothetical protein
MQSKALAFYINAKIKITIHPSLPTAIIKERVLLPSNNTKQKTQPLPLDMTAFKIISTL